MNVDTNTNAAAFVRIVSSLSTGRPLREAVDAELGAGAFDRMMGEPATADEPVTVH